MRKNNIKKLMIAVFSFLCSLCLFAACAQGGVQDFTGSTQSPSQGVPPSPAAPPSQRPQEDSAVTAGTQMYRGFILDNVYHSKNFGDIHFNLYIPESYDGTQAYALFVTLPGYEGLYRFGAGANLRAEEFAFEAQRYNEKMIIVAPQLGDWGITSADQAVALTEYFIGNYNIDRGKVYANGYSGGGETLSLVMERRPELFVAVLHVSSVWDGAVEPLVNSRTPVYFVIGENDEYYGSARIAATYRQIVSLYEGQGLSAAEIAALAVLDVKDQAYFDAAGAPNQHGGGGFVAYDSQIMGWLFSHSSKEVSYEQYCR